MSQPSISGDSRPRAQHPLSSTYVNRREFLGLSLGWLAFWRRRDHRRLAGIEFRILRHGHSARRYLRIHGNEQTAREVLTAHLKRASGVAYIVENQIRNVALKSGLLDPNRMFSREGAERNLRTLNPGWTDAQVQSALAALDHHRHEVSDAVLAGHGDVTIAMHNNGPGYSVADEMGISDEVALNDKSNPHEFCLCVDPRDYAALARGAYNVVLQNKAPREDDGSLSRLAARQGRRYVNIEAGHGKFDKQRAILEWVDKTLPSKWRP